MTAAFHLPRRRTGQLLVLLSLLPMMMALHQLLVLMFDYVDGSTTPARAGLLALQALGAALLTGWVLRLGVRRL
jgi:hypothetical protein